MKLGLYALIVLPAVVLLSCSRSNTPARQQHTVTAPVDKKWSFAATPVWSDEFDYSGAPNPTKWGYDLGGGGWGNNEAQFYTNRLENARVEDGRLVITAIKEKMENREYTSTRLISKGKGDFLYGRFEVKAKLPSGRGTWPAIWMLPTDWEYGGWPRSGEIDIMEHVGYDPERVHISTHTEAYNHIKNTQKTAIKSVPGAMAEFHVYRVDWTPYAVRGYIDNQFIFEHINEGKGVDAWPFDKKFHLLINLAVGGNWGAVQGIDDTVFPAVFEVDYVRVYEMLPL